MAHVFIVHGVEGYPEKNWFPWLKKELEHLGHTVIVPQFPTPENQTLSRWFEVIEQYREFLLPTTLLVGHSLGVPFLLNVVEKYPAKALFCVAGFVGRAGNQFDDSMVTFAQRYFDWQQIKKNCQHFMVFHSDNDPYIKLEKAEELAEYLGVQVSLVPGAGHFNARAGYKTFDLLLEYLSFLTARTERKRSA